MEDIFLIKDLNISNLIMEGFYVGVLITFSVGFVAYGIRYALKLFRG